MSQGIAAHAGYEIGAVQDWPPLCDPELLARLRLPDQQLHAHLAPRLARLAPRACSPALLERALSYPWDRPTGAFLLRNGRVHALDADAQATRRAPRDELARLRRPPRLPLLAIGSNAAPSVLAAKLAPLGDEDRVVLVLSGRLRDFDIAPSAHLAVYGAMPATICPSPGTAVAAAILWVSPRQLQRLAQTERSYALGRLRARFVPDGVFGAVDAMLAFVSRFGRFCPDGEDLALAAVPARGRRARACTQAELLEMLAQRVIGPGAGAPELLREACRDFASLWTRVLTCAPGEPLHCADFERYPA